MANNFQCYCLKAMGDGAGRIRVKHWIFWLLPYVAWDELQTVDFLGRFFYA